MDSFRRLIAAVETDETSFGEVLMAAGLAVPYGEERNWCASETAAG
jgi:endonuclease YncB( thermonuclease family)